MGSEGSRGQLNARQLEAVRYIDGPLLVLAGAGSGKTRVITRKIAYLIRECGIPARHVAAVTFTNKAAREMRSRVTGLLRRGEARGLRVSTFHTLGLNILRREAERAGLRAAFSIFDARDSADLLRELGRGQGLDDTLIEGMGSRIGSWKDALSTPEQALAQAADEREGLAARLYGDYQRSLRAYNAVDFDDLIAVPVGLFTRQREVLEHWQGRIRYLLVDEYQDTNAAQYQLVRLLAGVRGALTVVGDDDQSIYAWRGARPQNLGLLQEDFRQLRVVKLEQNYRSTRRILRAANALIDHNPHVFPKVLWSELGEGETIRVLRAKNETHEAQWIVSEILSHRFRHGTPLRDYAILYRGNHQSRPFEQALREHRVPYLLSGGTSFFARPEVRDILAYLRLLVNPEDDGSFLRVANTPRRALGPQTLEALGDYARGRSRSLYAAVGEVGLEQVLSGVALARLRRFTEWLEGLARRAEHDDPLVTVRAMVAEMDYAGWLEESCKDPRSAQRRQANVEELLEWLGRMRGDDGEELALPDRVARLTLMDILERQDEAGDEDRVSLMTLHAAKGLEFPHVFVAGAEEELLPHRENQEGEGLEEERRLAYVGMTRAQRSLTFTYSAMRKRYGEWEAREPSRFLKELPAGDLSWKGLEGEEAAPEERQARGRAHLANLKDMLG